MVRFAASDPPINLATNAKYRLMRYVEWMLVFLSAWRDADSKQLASFYLVHGLKILHRKWIKQFIMCVAVLTSIYGEGQGGRFNRR